MHNILIYSNDLNISSPTLNSLTKEQVMAGVLKLETILLVCAFSLCRVFGKFFLVKDLMTLMSNPSVSSSFSRSGLPYHTLNIR